MGDGMMIGEWLLALSVWHFHKVHEWNYNVNIYVVMVRSEEEGGLGVKCVCETACVRIIIC